jgi:hypothetical protein
MPRLDGSASIGCTERERSPSADEEDAMSGSTRPQSTDAPDAPRGEASGGRTDADETTRLREENARLRDQVRELRQLSEAEGGPRRHRIRSVTTVVLIVLTSLAILATTVGVWLNRSVWDTDRYVALVEPVADDPAVIDALATKLTDEVFVALDVQDRVERAVSEIPRIPDSATFVIGPIVAATKNLVHGRVETFLASDRFHDLWVRVNEAVHTKVVALLDGDYASLPNLELAGGEVRLNLVSAVATVLRNVVQGGVTGLGLDITVPTIPADLDSSAAIAKLGSALGVTLPADFGQVTIMTQEQLTGYQQAARRVQRIGWLLVALSIVLVIACVLVGVNRRRVAIGLGLGVVVALILGGAVLRRVGAQIVDTIAAPTAKAVTRQVFETVGGSLRHAGILVGVCALAVSLFAYLTGKPRWLVAGTGRLRALTASRSGGASELEAWAAARTGPLRVGIVVASALLLFVTGIGWVSVAIVGALAALGLWWLARAERRVIVVA